ncbi:MAG: ABC transporter permease [Microcoleaceae cyanobacterium]
MSPILNFEIIYHLRRPTFWLITILFFVIGLTDIVSKAEQGNAFFFVNSPSQIFQTTIWYTIFGILAASAFVAETFVRDTNTRMESLILSTPIQKWDYLITRFLAAFGITLLAFSSYLLGMILGTLMPGLNPFALGPLRLDAYFFSYLLFAIPNLFIVSAIAFSIASKTRSLAITYAGAIILVMLYLASLIMVGVDVIDFDQYQFWAMLDPFGFYAFEEQTLAWTVYQHNTLMPPLNQTLVWNRLIWICIGLITLTLGYRGYSMKLNNSADYKSVKTVQNQAFSSSALSIKTININLQTSQYPQTKLDLKSLIQQWIYRSGFEIKSVLQGRAFLLLTGFGLISLVMSAMGTRSYNYSNPSTDILIHSANIYLEYILFAIIIIYSAELIWRDRDFRLHSVLDATPISNSILLLSKLTTLFVIITLNLLLAMVVMVIYQILKGYTNFDFPLYFQMLFVEHGPYFYLTAILALFTQVITRQKYAGMALALAISLSKIPLDALGWYHNLYRFAATNDIEYSPMNGYGHLFTGHLWYSFYWGILGAIMMVIAAIYWPRGIVEKGHFKRSWQQAGNSIKQLLAGLIVLFAGVGGWIFYNTNILNEYQPPGKEETAAEIEKQFKQYESLPMPVVTETKLNIELYPDQRYFIAQGEYLLENKTQQPINEIHLITFINLDLEEVSYPGLTLREAHPKWGYYIYDLEQPLMPGQRQTMEFTTRTQRPQGFKNQVNSDDVYMIYPNDVVGNGTNLYSPFILPFVGYTKMVEHKKAWLRDKLDLPPLDERMREHNDPIGRSQGLMLTHLGWGKTEITVGTSEDQIAIAAGKLVNQWRSDGRNYFQYQSTTLDRQKFTIYSGKYAVYRNENYRIPIEVYYHPQHQQNVELIAEEVGKALEFYEQKFGDYPFEQVRVVEFVYYDGMVFSEGGVIGIPEVLVWKSEAQGLGKESIIDWVTYLFGYSWWEDQIISADVAGGMTIREALSSYGNLLYQRSRRTPQEQQLARQQLMRDYFRDLGKIDFKEPPLIDVYNELPIARFKGGMVLEQIENLIGQEALLTGIQDFLKTYRYKSEPYPTVLDLQDAILKQASPANQKIIRDLFANVVTYQVGLADAVYQALPNGKYKMQLKIEAQQLYTKNLGEQELKPLDFPLTISLLNKEKQPIYSEQYQISNQQASIEIILDQQPTYAAVDRNYILPSAFLQDNIKRIRPAL